MSKAKEKDYQKEWLEAVFLGDVKQISIMIDDGFDINTKDQNDNTALSYLAHHRYHPENIKVMDYLIDHGAELGVINKDNETPLIISLKHDNRRFARRLLEKSSGVGLNIDVQNKSKNSALHYTLLRGQSSDIAQQLISYGANVHLKNDWGRTPLMIAAKYDNFDVVKSLFKAGADVDINVEDNFGNTPLLFSLSNVTRSGTNKEMVQLFLEHGADIDHQNSFKETFLFEAVASGYVEFTKFALDHGANVDLYNNAGVTPSYKAFSNHSIEIARLLISHDADVNIQSESGSTPLMYVTSFGSVDEAKILIEAGAKIELEDKDGRTAFLNAASAGKIDMMELLVDNGADIEHKDKKGLTALMLAVRNSRDKAVDFLLEHGVKLDALDKNENTVLINGATSKNTSIVESLSSHVNKTQIDFQNKDGKTALMMATEEGNVTSVMHLINKGANINLTDKHNRSALMVAVEHQKTSLVKVFVENKADLKIRDDFGKTAFDYAKENYVFKNDTELLSKLDPNKEIKQEHSKQTQIPAI